MKLLLILALATFAFAQTPSPQKGPTKMTTARGTFDVKVAPIDAHHKDAGIGRMSIDKTFHGDLDGTSQGEMLTGMSPTEKGSGAYVAIEKVTGKLHGRTGTFIFHHQGIMDRGQPSLSVTVVPDSGTGELTGLTGKMNIIIDGKKHSYEFDYTLPAKP